MDDRQAYDLAYLLCAVLFIWGLKRLSSPATAPLGNRIAAAGMALGPRARVGTPKEAAAGRTVIEEAAARAGRAISPEHFGMSVGYASAPIDPDTARTMAARRPRSLELTPVGYPALRKTLEQFIAVGFSKFVVRPVAAPRSWRAELEALAAAVGDLQT